MDDRQILEELSKGLSDSDRQILDEAERDHRISTSPEVLHFNGATGEAISGIFDDETIAEMEHDHAEAVAKYRERFRQRG